MWLRSDAALFSCLRSGPAPDAVPSLLSPCSSSFHRCPSLLPLTCAQQHHHPLQAWVSTPLLETLSLAKTCPQSKPRLGASESAAATACVCVCCCTGSLPCCLPLSSPPSLFSPLPLLSPLPFSAQESCSSRDDNRVHRPRGCIPR